MFLIKLISVSYFYVNSHKMFLLYIQWYVSICFGSIFAFLSSQNSSKKMLNAETVSKMKTQHGVLVSCLYFGVVQNHISKTNMFRQLLIKVEEKVCLMLCVIETRKATDTMSNEFIQIKAEQKLLRLYTEKNSP